MRSTVLSGMAAGVLLALGVTASLLILPSPVYGHIPLLIAAIAGVAVSPLARPRLPGGATSRILTAAAAPVLTIALWMLGEATGGFSFLSTDAGILPFLLLLLIHLIAIGVPLALLAARRRASSALDTPAFLAGGAASLALVLFAGTGVLATWIILAALSSLLGAADVLLPESPATARSKRTDAGPPSAPKPRPSHKGPAPHATRPSKRPTAVASPDRGLPRIAIGVILLVFIVWVPITLQGLRELGMSDATLFSLVLPGTLLAAAAGGALERRLREASGDASLSALSLAVMALSIAIGAYRYAASLYPSIYIATFDAAGDTGAALFELVAWTLLIPAVCAGALSARIPAFRPGRAGQTDLALWAAAIAVIAAVNVVFPEESMQTHALQFAGLAFFGMGTVLAAALRTRRPAPRDAVALALAAAPVVLPLLAPPMGFSTLVMPERFRVQADVVVPGGRFTSLLSRDYDDPFHATMWNTTVALTQNSRSVHPALYRLGHIPMLMSANPRSVLLFGLGSGAALEAVKMYGPKRVVCVEPAPPLVWLEDSLARQSNRASLTAGVEFHAERPAAFVARCRDRFDVAISAEPFAEPYRTPSIFTPDYYRGVSGLLAPGGVFAQCLTVSTTGLAGVRAVAASMLASFRDVEAWLAQTDADNGMIILVGSNAPFTAAQPDSARLGRLLTNQQTAFHLRTIALSTWPEVLGEWAMDRAALARFAADARPPSAFGALPVARSNASSEGGAAMQELLAARVPPSRLLAGAPDSLRARTLAIFSARPALLAAGIALARGDDTTATRTTYDILRSEPHNEEAAHVLSGILQRRAAIFIQQGRYTAAIPLLNEVLKIAPLNTFTLRLLMIAAMQNNDKLTSGATIDALKRLDPRHAGFRDNQATIRAQQGGIDDALLLYENAITIDPTNEEFYCNMASVQFQIGHAWEAIRILDNATRQSYYPAKAWWLKGQFYMDRGRAAEARNAYREYLRCATPDDPHRADVLAALARTDKER